MRRTTLAAVVAAAIATSASAQTTVTQTGFSGVIVPQYCASGTSTRLPVMFRATMSGLSPDTSYRYFNQAALASDFGGTNPGAGNPIIVSSDGLTFTYTTGPSLTTSGGYGTFTTDSSGNHTGWFGFVNTGNARFTSGNTVYPTIVIGDSSGALVTRRALDLGIAVLAFGATSTDGTGVWGASHSPGKEMVALFDSEAGTGRPLSVSFVENAGIAITSVVAFYSTNVSAQAGRWGTIIPNSLPGGVRRVERFAASNGASIVANTDSNGVWPSGADTVNPTGGTTAIAMTAGDAPLPVSLSGFVVD